MLLRRTTFLSIVAASALVALHLTVVPLGAPLGLTIALVVSVGANVLIWLLRRRGHARRMAALETPGSSA